MGERLPEVAEIFKRIQQGREFNGRENDQNPPVAMLNREYPNARKKDAES